MGRRRAAPGPPASHAVPRYVPCVPTCTAQHIFLFIDNVLALVILRWSTKYLIVSDSSISCSFLPTHFHITFISSRSSQKSRFENKPPWSRYVVYIDWVYGPPSPKRQDSDRLPIISQIRAQTVLYPSLIRPYKPLALMRRWGYTSIAIPVVVHVNII